MKKTMIAVILVLITACVGIYLGLGQMRARKASEEDKKDVNYQKAMSVLEEISSEPHPAGSKENERVRDYIVSEAESLGLEAKVLPFTLNVEEFIARSKKELEGDKAAKEATLKYIEENGYKDIDDYILQSLGNPEGNIMDMNNILVKAEYPKAKNAILFVAHYDSAPAPGGSFGAADDGLAVSIMVSYMKYIVESGGHYQNNIYFLFTDSEEIALSGAADFVENYPEYKEQIKAVFNLEARGSAGAPIMFETCKGDYDLVKHYNKAVSRPVTSSIATAIYDLMPNGTDFSEFKDDGYKGLNLAMIEKYETYHQPTDNFENISRDSAYGYYKTVFELGDYFGDLDLDTIEHDKDGIFFPFLGAKTVVIPKMIGYVLGVIPFVIAILLMIISKKRGESTLKSLKPLLLFAVLPLLTIIFAYPASYLFSIPGILFLVVDLLYQLNRDKKNVDIMLIAGLLVSAFVTIILFMPIIFLLNVALRVWFVTAICIIAALVPIVLYTRKVYCELKKMEMK